MENSIANRNKKTQTNWVTPTTLGQRPKKLSPKLTTNLVLVLVPKINRTGSPVLCPVLKSF